MSVWTLLGAVPPRDLTETRLEVHHAVQLVSIAVGRALVPHRDDDSHTALRWLAEEEQWIGETIPGSGGARAGLPSLPGGHWHTEGFFAAVLTATELLDGDEEGQEARAAGFLSAAVENAYALWA